MNVTSVASDRLVRANIVMRNDKGKNCRTDESSGFLRNVCSSLPNYTSSHQTRLVL